MPAAPLSREYATIGLQGQHSECEQLFFSAPLVVVEDLWHSMEEVRYLALGKSDNGRLFFVVFTPRGTLIHVISARSMSRHEQNIYRDAEAKE